MKIRGRFLAIGWLVAAGLAAYAPPVLGQGGAKGTRVEGVVQDAAGKAVANAAVVLQGSGKPFEAKTISDTAGKFAFEEVATGDYELSAKAVGSERAVPCTIHVKSDGKAMSVLVRLGEVTESRASDPKAIEFDDKASFTVAGVTDWSNTGIHGSDMSVRTSETLAKETLALKDGVAGPDSAGNAGAMVAGAGESERDLRAARGEARKRLAAGETADLHRAIGDMDEKLGDPLEAVREYEKAVKLEPSEANYFAWGTELILHKADQPAVEVFASGSKRHPDSARLLEGMGVALYGVGSYDEAAKKMCEAADLNPGEATAYLFLGKMDKAAPSPLPCAEEKLARFAQLQPENATANYYFGVALRKRANALENLHALRRSEAIFQKVVSLDPKFSDGFLQLGIVRVALGNLGQATRDYERAIELNPQSAEAHYRLGTVCRMTGDMVRAETELTTYKRLEKEEAAEAENQRKELRQFVITLKEQR
jgi:tetratricopeptide (TPR) repeat protein